MLASSSLAPDFSSFVASDYGISPNEAELLIEDWLAKYRPQAPRPIQFLMPGGSSWGAAPTAQAEEE
jgi:hypothetical protein